MARIRTIKPEFFTSLTIADLPLTARLTFIGLWTHVDDEGRCVDEPRLIRAAVWPLDDRLTAEVEKDVQALHDASLIVRYEHAGRRYLTIRTWSEHQRIDKAKPSKHPAPEDGTPLPPTPPDDSDSKPLTSTNPEFADEPTTHPGAVHDASTTHPGRVPVGTGNREGNRDQGKEGGARTREADTNPPAAPAPALRPDGRPAPIDDDGFTLTDAMRRWAIDTFGNALDIDYETAQFVSHHRAEGKRRRNWPEEWRKWMRRSAKWASERAQQQHGAVVPLHRPGTPRPSTTDARVQAAVDLGRQMQAEADAAAAAKEAQ